MNIDKIIGIVRKINEEAVAAPTMSVAASSSTTPPGIAGIDANPPVRKKKKKGEPTIIGRGRFPGARKRWMT